MFGNSCLHLVGRCLPQKFQSGLIIQSPFVQFRIIAGLVGNVYTEVRSTLESAIASKAAAPTATSASKAAASTATSASRACRAANTTVEESE